MSHDDELVGRVRALSGGAEEKRMFGSLAFCVDGRIVLCVRGDGLLVRVGLPRMSEALAVDGVQTAVMGTREMHGWVTVPADLVDTETALRRWWEVGLAAATDAGNASGPGNIAAGA